MITNSQKLHNLIQISFLFAIIPVLNQLISLFNYFHFEILTNVTLAFIGIMKISLPFLIIILIASVFCQKKEINYYIIIFTALLVTFFFNSDFFFTVNNINYHFLLTNIFALCFIGYCLAYLNDNFAFNHHNSFKKIYFYLIVIIFICSSIFYICIYLSQFFANSTILINLFANFSDQTLYVLAVFLNYAGSFFANIYTLHPDIINYAIYSNLDVCTNLTSSTCQIMYTNYFAQILNVIFLPAITYLIIYLKIRQNNYSISKIPLFLSLILIIFFKIDTIFYLFLTLISIPLLLLVSLFSTINAVILPHILPTIYISSNPFSNLQMIIQLANIKQILLFLFLFVFETITIYLIIFKAKFVNITLFRQVNNPFSDEVHLATLHHDLNKLLLIIDFSSIHHIEFNDTIDIVLNRLIPFSNIEFINFKIIAQNDLLISVKSFYQDDKEIYEQLIYKHYEYLNNEFQTDNYEEISEIIN